MKPYVEFTYCPMTSRIGIAGCEGDPVDPATVQQYAELGNESAQAALAAIRMADAHDELRLARRALHITRSPIAWGRLLRAQVDVRLAHRALHSPPLKQRILSSFFPPLS